MLNFHQIATSTPCEIDDKLAPTTIFNVVHKSHKQNATFGYDRSINQLIFSFVHLHLFSLRKKKQTKIYSLIKTRGSNQVK